MGVVRRKRLDLVSGYQNVRDGRPSRGSDTRDNGPSDLPAFSCMVEGSQNVSRAEALDFIETMWVRLSDNLIDTDPPGQQAEAQRRKLRILEAIYVELNQ